jgi:hypothetical protein
MAEDDRFAATLFHGRFDSSEIRAAMHALVANAQSSELMIVTCYLDMAELDGSPPSLAGLARRLQTAPPGVSAPGVSAEYARDALVDFLRLLAFQRAIGEPGQEAS